MLEIIPQIDSRLLGLLATLLSLATSLLGLAVGYIAFRGYRHGSQPMLYVAIGFVLVFWAPFLLFLGNLLVAGLPEFLLSIVGEVSQLSGMICILYGLYMPREREENRESA